MTIREAGDRRVDSPAWRQLVGDQLRLIGHLLRWVTLGGVVGVLAGLSSAAFLQALSWATGRPLRVDGRPVEDDVWLADAETIEFPTGHRLRFRQH